MIISINGSFHIISFFLFFSFFEVGGGGGILQTVSVNNRYLSFCFPILKYPRG